MQKTWIARESNETLSLFLHWKNNNKTILTSPGGKENGYVNISFVFASLSLVADWITVKDSLYSFCDGDISDEAWPHE